ncbi:FAD:protein FMN transferase [Pokkaliibacter sp. CJK22405]|uniref:FAD:protein FMN transferase n=1 Tax=Pokkaliibacter sp. CJK22405 TaxID=3384615 RepID=UPI003984702F
MTALQACSKPPEIQRVEGYAQGTTYHISWWSETSLDTGVVEQQFQQQLASIDKELSTYRDDSYISRFNASPSTDWQPASQDFIDLITLAKSISQKTQGCYDPTLGPLFGLWGFRKDVLNVPTPEQIQAVKAHMGMDKLEVDEVDHKIRKTVPDLQVDFSSMGEGYTIGKLTRILEDMGVTNYLVEFGGDMKIRGHKPDGKKWRIAIERPVPGNKTVHRIVTINDESGVTLDTSGTYRHHFDADGKRYSHILDPRTGAPVTHDLVSASVFGVVPRESDAWATAMLCMGQEEGMKVAEQEHLDVYFIQQKSASVLIDSFSPSLKQEQRVTFEKE